MKVLTGETAKLPPDSYSQNVMLHKIFNKKMKLKYLITTTALLLQNITYRNPHTVSSSKMFK